MTHPYHPGAAQPPTPVPPPSPPAQAGGAGRGFRVAGILAIAVAVLVFGGIAGGFQLWSQQWATRAAKSDGEMRDLMQDDADAISTVATVFGLIGATVLIAGAGLFLVGIAKGRRG